MAPVSPGSSDPFLAWQAGTFSDQLASRIAAAEPSLIWAGRATALAKLATPVLAHIRQIAGADLPPDDVMQVLRLDNLISVARNGSITLRDSTPLETADMPECTVCDVARYLDELPGRDPRALLEPESSARTIHSYAMMAIRRSCH